MEILHLIYCGVMLFLLYFVYMNILEINDLTWALRRDLKELKEEIECLERSCAYKSATYDLDDDD